MSDRLFIELYLDEDVDVLVAELLRVRGYSAVTSLEAHMLGASDQQQFDFAIANQRTILTHNRIDFEEQVRQAFTAKITHPGIIIAARHSPQEIVRRLLVIFNSTTADEMWNQLRYI